MKLYSFYTASHKIFKNEWFLPSLKDKYEVILEEDKQKCSSGRYMEDGWLESMRCKVNLIIRAVKENWDRIFIYSDVDIQFFRPTEQIIQKLIQKKDMVVQQDSPSGMICAGFIAMRGSKKMLRLWEDIRSKLIMEDNKKYDDQGYLNSILIYNKCFMTKIYRMLKVRPKFLYHNIYGIKWSYLPLTFFSTGTVSGKIRQPGEKISIPKNIVMHHANWAIGIENKIAILETVRNIVETHKVK